MGGAGCPGGCRWSYGETGERGKEGTVVCAEGVGTWAGGVCVQTALGSQSGGEGCVMRPGRWSGETGGGDWAGEGSCGLGFRLKAASLV